MAKLPQTLKCGFSQVHWSWSTAKYDLQRNHIWRKTSINSMLFSGILGQALAQDGCSTL